MTTNIEIKNAKPKSKDYTLNIDTGLSILVKTSGSKLWRFRYSFSGKRCMISLGKYPQIPLKDARVKVREYQDMLDKGLNPSTQRKITKVRLATERDFQTVALEWHNNRYKHKDKKHAEAIKRRLELYLFPAIGKLLLKDIEAPMLFNLIEKVQDMGYVETGKRVNSYASMIFRYGVAKGYCKRDVTQDYKGMLKSAKPVHMPTLVDKDEIGEFLNDMDNYNGTVIIKTALLVSAYTFVRPRELAQSQWAFIDFDKHQWLIPADLMKMGREHLVPLSQQVETLLRALYSITGSSKYIFPNERSPDKPIHNETVNKTLRRIENGKYIGRMVSHGFRAMASTLLNENQFRADVIEKQLAHQEANKVRGAYNHAEYLQERVEMMQWYADYLDSLKVIFTTN